MRTLILLMIAGFIITSCDTSEDTVTTTEAGNMYLRSNPPGAQIWIDSDSTSYITPDTVKNVSEGVHEVTLKLQDYNDTTFSVTVNTNETSIVDPVDLVSDINLTFYSNPVRIWETSGTSASQPSGLDLSSGIAYGVSSPDSGLVDIYYSSNGYLIQSANLHPGLIRETDFMLSNSDDIYDDVDSPTHDTNWINNIPDSTTNYVFLYDHDGHYSKLIIVDSGGNGTPGNPFWIEVIWYYNNEILDERF